MAVSFSTVEGAVFLC